LSKRGGPPERAGDILKRVLSEAGLDRPEQHGEIARAWRDVAGPDVAAETSVQSFRKGVLTILVRSAPLLSELTTYQREELLAGMRARLAGTFVDQLRFRLG
jgi:predicted nucleic acid-binding Zn ribbon protein